MQIFIAAVDEGSFAAAARRFKLSAAMAGKHVSAIESDLNVRLLQRSTRRLSLTDAGERYYERCKVILEVLEDANREASDVQKTPKGLLRVAAPVAFGAMHLGRIVSRYLEQFPEVSLDVVLEDKYADLLENRIDVAIRVGRLEDPTLVTRRLAPCRMVLCASPEYLKKHGTPETPDHLSRAPRLAFSQAVSAGDWTIYDAQGRAHSIEGPCRMTANNIQLLLESVLAGTGIAYGPNFVFGEHIKQGKLIKLLPAYRTTELTIQAVYPSAIRIPFKVRSFVDFIAKALGDTPLWGEEN
ncbi:MULTISPECIES: LysR family transcriptional regulator [Klebsiella]|uniref:LysR family transcriptional regulator n=1 Tax=Klebsiella TaxID=570 RepID=UPI0002975DCE|nr:MULTISPECIES: LysR family transcriptional regulator [Klebsiella]EKP28978.1 LysR family transcriptional regulator [Klebsiella michiganensis]ARI06624.1 LysR family transcriptional regulator [Klebsiella sp. M5al]EMB3268029.1 LysR family transcriptional regulator [Klebsiella michiganensis]KZT48777.1 LysR family transcriptional regulator [Klebsiella michiganensis]MBZ0044638.1 LysR family transcriptional regulator [Klebsiella grimontii]